MLNKSPIVLFVYKRLTVKKTIESLKKNQLYINSDLFIFSDGSRNQKDLNDVLDVRKYLKTITGFQNIKIIESEKNKGLAKSVISGVTEILSQYENVIVLEDDLIVSSDFLEYMNRSIEFYEKDKNIWSISGYGPNLPCLKDYKNDVYLSVRSSSWGWATWKDRWDAVDWKIEGFQKFKNNKELIKKFNVGGNDMYKMLELQILGKIDSWAIRWCYNQFLHNTYCVYPRKSKIINDGFNDSKGTHNSSPNNKWVVELDNKKLILNKLSEDEKILKCFQSYFNLNLNTKIGYFLKKYGYYKLAKKIYNFSIKTINNIVKDK